MRKGEGTGKEGRGEHPSLSYLGSLHPPISVFSSSYQLVLSSLRGVVLVAVGLLICLTPHHRRCRDIRFIPARYTVLGTVGAQLFEATYTLA